MTLLQVPPTNRADLGEYGDIVLQLLLPTFATVATGSLRYQCERVSFRHRLL